MNELVAGIDLCDEYTQVNCNDEEKTWTFPTVLCRHKVSGTWSVGEDAYAQTLRGEGSLTDKLVKLVKRRHCDAGRHPLYSCGASGTVPGTGTLAG